MRQWMFFFLTFGFNALFCWYGLVRTGQPIFVVFAGISTAVVIALVVGKMRTKAL